MFTPTTDYNQQLLAYLQTWRALLEQWTTMAAGSPFATVPSAIPTAPPGGPFMPPMPLMPLMPPMPPMAPTVAAPSTPPAPADYTQQLFSYLQAWRQYLEQMTGARPGVAQPPNPQHANAEASHPAGHSGQANPAQPPKDIPPDTDSGGRSNLLGIGVTSNPTRPPLVNKAPATEGGSQVPPEFRLSSASLFNRGPEVPEKLNPPVYDFGNQIDRFRRGPDTSGPAVSSARPQASRHAEAPAEPSVGSPFLRTMGRVASNPLPQAAPKSLFSSPAARTASTRLRPRDAGQTPSP
jgi:hypothetical protein